MIHFPSFINGNFPSPSEWLFLGGQLVFFLRQQFPLLLQWNRRPDSSPLAFLPLFPPTAGDPSLSICPISFSRTAFRSCFSNMSDYDDDYSYDDYDEYEDYDEYDGGYDDEGYDYGDYDHNEYDHHGAHDHDDHDAGGDAVAEELTAGFAVIEEVEDHHDQGSAFDGSDHEEHTGYAELAHSDDDYQTGDDQVPYYGVVSGGPSYVQDHNDHPTSRSQSQYTPSAPRGSAGYPPFAANGMMVDPQSHGRSYSQHPSSRSSGYQYNGNHHGSGR